MLPLRAEEAAAHVPVGRRGPRTADGHQPEDCVDVRHDQLGVVGARGAPEVGLPSMQAVQSQWLSLTEESVVPAQLLAHLKIVCRTKHRAKSDKQREQQHS